MTSDELPPYDSLPVRKDAPARSSWGVWGDGDVFGCLNLLTAQRVRSAARLVQRGQVFALNWEMELPDPPLFGRAPFEHAVSWLPAQLGHDDAISNWNTQSSSQWDGFRHLQSDGHGFYAGVADEQHGVHHWARRGLAGRAVVLDVGRWRCKVGRPIDMTSGDVIEPQELLEVARDQNVAISTGDVLLIRTGWISWYRTLTLQQREQLASSPMSCPGLRGCEETARVLWDLHVAAVASDTPAFEALPPRYPTDSETDDEGVPAALQDAFVHLRLIPLLGMPIGELWDLDALAADCAADGRWEGLFTSAPLNLQAGVASPPNALVIK